jgi:hypothetical protein
MAAAISAAESRFHIRANAPSSGRSAGPGMSEAHFGAGGGRVARRLEQPDRGQAVFDGAAGPPGALGVTGAGAVGLGDSGGEAAQLPLVGVGVVDRGAAGSRGWRR